MSPPAGVSVVIPTLRRPSLDALVRRLAGQVDGSPVPVEVLVVPDPDRAGPAKARNAGWSAARYEWVAFLDDDVLPAPDWLAALLRDLDQPPDVGGVQGVVSVPCSVRPDDWERNTAGLARAAWATADMAYRRAALESVSGFDERFPRAYREDADLAYRVRRHGWRLVTGTRRTVHPVRPAGRWVSLAAQRGNADDALLRRLHGPDWHERLSAPAGRRHRHAAVVGAGLAAAALAILGQRGRRIGAAPVRVGGSRHLAARRAVRAGTALSGAAWLAGTAEFAAVRVRRAPGSDPVALALTSVLIPPLAVGHWLRGWLRFRGAPPWPDRATAAPPSSSPSRSVYPQSPRETACHVRISAARPIWKSVRRGAVG
ncbi:glycosyltransferase family 2 protein [Rugosimonospora africana]|uniref:Transferase n=1 Tax=Rugosimonospora africana TaxID=556532 RepID=A0A8J3VN56_9ACTN|nr:glycosyltransferase family 2 protein [Rugosimonospora africana]GIH12864.1 transferase [Rugosimonospora africana]